MSCRKARNALVHGARLPVELAHHFERCDDCARFARRWETLRTGLRRHRAAATPDAGFAARVAARLPATPGALPESLSWAAWRLLPAGLALVLVLTGWCLLATPAPTSLGDQLADGDLLSWAVAEAENGR